MAGQQEFSIVGNLLLKVDGAENGLNKLKNSLNQLKVPANLDSDLKKSFSNLDGLFAKYKAQLKNGFNTKTDVSSFVKTGKQIEAEYDRISRTITKLTGQEISLRFDSTAIQNAQKQLEKLLADKEKLINDAKNGLGLDNIFSATRGGKIAPTNGPLYNASKIMQTSLEKGDIAKARQDVETLIAELNRLSEARRQALEVKTGMSFDNIVTTLRTKIEEADNTLNKFNGDIKTTSDNMANLKANQMERANKAINDAAISADKLTSGFKQINGGAQQAANSMLSMTKQVEQLQQSTQYFFSLRNMLNLFKRGIREAVATVKDLDKAMTETAVVTKYSVGDMWAKLPEYTANANALGATVQDMYESTTLYYQQGLNTQQAMSIATETMKMARIAGMEAADATDMMTAALRGFNMEINETSAERINDVYSNLAAKTASNTQELGTAMQRTASIAHSAGMSFEGTAAFLAQAIETTREPAENLGTAMKTIIARFQELKKNPLEITDVDGEEVSYNKVDAALKTIGVDLKDTNGQFRDLDKVFLDISQKWDGLSQTQQRYIATTAAGSRQQSRFIAMMSDYERTMELMGYANDSAGASTTQFNKTLDSLEAKINKFQNAWKQFLMGIMNDSWTKKVVDAGTTVLNIVNKIIDTLSFGGKAGLLKSVLSTFTAFTALKVAGRGANVLIGGLGGMVDPTSSFRAGAQTGMLGKNSAQAINQPIVKELQSIRALISQKINQSNFGKASVIGPYDEYHRLKAARMNVMGMNGRGTVGDLTKQLSGLSSRSQNILMNSNSSMFRSATNALIGKYGSQNRGAVRKGERFLNNERRSARLTAEEYYNALQDPGLLRDAMAKAGVSKDNAAYKYIDGLDQQVTQEAERITKERQAQAYGRWADKNPQATADEKRAYLDELNKKYGRKEWQDAARKSAISNLPNTADNNTLFSTSKFGQALDGIGQFGAGLSQAGMGIQAFGGILSASANPALQMFGSMLTSVGGLVSGLGMGISGLSAAFNAVASSALIENMASKLLAATKLSEAAAATALTGGLFILVAAVAGAALWIKKHNENIKKAAEEVTTNYKEKNDKAQTNISNLQSWKEDFARLVGGVDSNGYNVNLSTEDYDRYLEITRGIAEINPSIVEGYNAQGQAIITNNKALEETLALEKEHQAEAFQEYISPESLNALVKARDLAKERKTLEKEQTSSYYGGQVTNTLTVTTDEFEFKPQASMRKNAQKVGRTLQEGIKEGWATDELLEDFNIDIGKLAEGDEETLDKFNELGPKIQQRINNAMDAAGDSIKESTKNNMTEAFTGYSDAAEELEELITPTYEQLLASTSKYATAIPTEFKQYFNQGLKEIASDANIDDVNKAARDFAGQFSVLTEKGGDYYELLQDVKTAQDDYARTLDKDTYDKFVNGADGAKSRIEALKDSLGKNMDLTKGYGKAISDFLDNELAKIEKFTESGSYNLQHALNSMVDLITEAEGALEKFNAIAEGSTYGKAASNMSQIFETATAEEHAEGEGDQAFWAGAEAIVGRKNLLENGEITKDKALAQMKEVQEMLKGGQEGWDNFKIKWFDSVEAMGGELFHKNKEGIEEAIEGVEYYENGWIKSIDEDINPEVYDQLADALNMSKESLIAMLNLGRQFGDISFTNVEDVRKALATSESTIKNSETGKVFVKQDFLESEMTQAGIDLNQQQDIINDLQEKYNTELIKSIGEITKDNNQFKEMGIDSMESLVKTFDETGQFTKEEIAEYGEKWAEYYGDEPFDPAEFERIWNENQADQEFGGIPNSLDSIESILNTIASTLTAQRLSEGYLDNPTASAAKDWLLGRKGQDTDAQYFWKGKGASGEDITVSEFNKTSKELTDFIEKSEDYIANLDKAKDAATERKDYEELGKIEQEQLAYKNMLDYARKYLEEGTEAYDSQIQNKLEGLKKDSDLVNKGFSDLFDSVTPESINTDQAQNTLNQLYQAAISNNPITLTDDIKTQMENLGVDVERAIEAGLVVDTDGVNDKAKDAGEKSKKEADDAYAEGQSSEKTDTSKSEASGEKAAKEQNKAYADGQDNTAGAPSTPSSTPSLPQGVLKAEEHDSKITPQVDTSQLEDGQEKAQALTDTLSQGANYVITVSGVDNLERAAEAASKVTQNSGAKTVGVKTSFDSSAATKGVTNINNMSAKIKVGANVDQATAAARRMQRTIDAMTATIDVSANFKGSWSHDVNINIKKNYSKTGEPPHTGGYITSGGVLYRAKGGDVPYPKKGTDRIPAYLTPGEYVQNRKAVQYFGIDFMRKINHKDLVGALQSFGSAAKGRYGRLGPNGKGGLTLTGEEGYEVAWIPSENRSMILGANGPQMANLPSDTVVWDHKQSKKIISQGAIPAGSHKVTGKEASDPRKTTPAYTPPKTDTKGTEKAVKKTSANVEQAVTTTTAKAGKVIVWWENQEHKIDAVLRKVDKSQKTFDKILKTVDTTIQEVRAVARINIKDLQQSIKVNTEAKKQAQADLIAADKGTARQQKARDEKKAAQVALKAAKKSKNKSKIKKAQQKLDAANKKVKSANAAAVARGTSAQISWEEKDKKGKKVNKKANISLSPYIKKDSATGAYVIDQAKIDKVAKKNKSKAEAIKSAANQVIDDKQGKLNKADDNIDKAKDQIDEIGQQIYDTFFSWRNELTKVYNISQKLEALEKRKSNLESGQELIKAQMAAGKISLNNAKAMSAELFKGQVAATTAAIKMGNQKINAQKTELQRVIKNDDNKDIRANISNKISDLNTALKNDQKYEDAKKKRQKVQADESKITAAAKIGKRKGTKIDPKKVTVKQLKNEKAQQQAQLKELKEQLKKTKNKKKQDQIKKDINKAEKNIKTIEAGIKARQNLTADVKAYNKVKKNDNKKYDLTSTQIANRKASKAELEAEQKALKAEYEAHKKAKQYSKVSYNADGTINLEINYDKIEADRKAGQITAAEADEIKEYLEKIQEENNNLLDAYNEQTSRMTELYQSLADLKQQQADHAKDLFEQYVENQKQSIENTKQINETINNSVKDLLDEVKNKLDERRKQEDNAKTERDISQKQQRLAALRADTSGGHQVTIAQLQKEINEAQESYGRTLEDQLLDKLDKQNNIAQKQREQQIALAEKQIELNTKNGIYAAHIDYLLENANNKSIAAELRDLWGQIMDSEGLPAIVQETVQAQIDANMMDVQTYTENYNNLNEAIKATTGYLNTLESALLSTATNIAQLATDTTSAVFTPFKTGEQSGVERQKNSGKDASKIQKEINEQNLAQSMLKHTTAKNITKSNGKTETGQISSSGKYVGVAKGSTLETYEWDTEKGKQGKLVSSRKITELTTDQFKSVPKEAKEALIYAIEHQKPGTLINKNIGDLAKAAGIIGQVFKLQNGIYGSISNTGGIYYNQGTKGVQKWNAASGKLTLEKYNKQDFKDKAVKYKNVGREYAQVLIKRGIYTQNQLKNMGVKFAKGGLADFTGPGWLDGTPSKPELVLNSRDTKNFITLKDILAKAMNNMGDASNTYGDITYEINVNVDKIEKDYDVDKVIEKVKKEIVKTSGYRNVTQIRNLR